MHTALCEQFGIEYPIFAFTHCRDVVVAVSRAGGMGVLGAAGFSPDALERELAWIDERVEGRPYGVDVIMPKSLERSDVSDPAELAHRIQAMIPKEHRRFVDELMERFDIPPLPSGEPDPGGILGWTHEVARQQVDVALSHPVSVLVNALGSPPPDVLDDARARGVRVGALAGKTEHALDHVSNGLDFVVAQGTEAGGHTGEIATMVLVPEVVEAVAPAPVLAAGGIASGSQIAAALALGAHGVWTGSVWLTTAESDTRPEVMDRYLSATSSDTVRSRVLSGKPARMLRSPWTEAWEQPDSPGTLPMPLQGLLVGGANTRIARAGRADLMNAPVGQVVGHLDQVRSARDVVYQMVEEYVDAVERLAKQLDQA